VHHCQWVSLAGDAARSGAPPPPPRAKGARPATESAFRRLFLRGPAIIWRFSIGLDVHFRATFEMTLFQTTKKAGPEFRPRRAEVKAKKTYTFSFKKSLFLSRIPLIACYERNPLRRPLFLKSDHESFIREGCGSGKALNPAIRNQNIPEIPNLEIAIDCAYYL